MSEGGRGKSGDPFPCLWVVSEPKLPRSSVCFPEAQKLPWKVDGVDPPPRAGLGTPNAPLSHRPEITVTADIHGLLLQELEVLL